MIKSSEFNLEDGDGIYIPPKHHNQEYHNIKLLNYLKSTKMYKGCDSTAIKSVNLSNIKKCLIS